MNYTRVTYHKTGNKLPDYYKASNNLLLLLGKRYYKRSYIYPGLMRSRNCFFFSLTQIKDSSTFKFIGRATRAPADIS